MTLAQLKAVCAAYHKKAVSDLTVNGVDLFLVAANNARKNGEKLQNFEMARVTATLDIDGETGGALSAAVIAGNAAPVGSITLDTLVQDPLFSTPFELVGDYNSSNLYFGTDDSTGDGAFIYRITTITGWILAKTINTTPPTNRFQKAATGNIPPSGVYSAHGAYTGTYTATISADEVTFSGIKEVQNVQRVSGDGTLEPLGFAPSEVAIERSRTEIEFDDEYWFENRYPSDARLLFRPGSGTIVQRNETLYVYPKVTLEGDPLSVVLEGYGWLSDYTTTDLSSSTEKDFFLAYGANYLQWAIIVDLNMYFKTFVSRSEGNLPAPTELRDEAWRDFVLWDSYKVNNNLTRSR